MSIRLKSYVKLGRMAVASDGAEIPPGWRLGREFSVGPLPPGPDLANMLAGLRNSDGFYVYDGKPA